MMECGPAGPRCRITEPASLYRRATIHLGFLRALVWLRIRGSVQDGRWNLAVRSGGGSGPKSVRFSGEFLLRCDGLFESISVFKGFYSEMFSISIGFGEFMNDDAYWFCRS